MFYYITILIMAFAISEILVRNQRATISSYTYQETLEDGRVIKKIRCPVCGNTELNYQIVYDYATQKHAVCPNCSNSFIVRTKPNRLGPLIFGCFGALFINLIVNIILMLSGF